MHILKPLSLKSKLNISFPLEARNKLFFVFFFLYKRALSPLKKNKAMLFMCLMLKKRKAGSRQNDGTMGKEETQRFPSLSGPPPAGFPQKECRRQSELVGWSSGKLSPALSELGSQEVD